MTPLLMEGHRFQPFFEKRLPRGAVWENGSSGTIFSLNMTINMIKGKNSSLFAKWSRCLKRCPKGAVSVPLFFSVLKLILSPLQLL